MADTTSDTADTYIRTQTRVTAQGAPGPPPTADALRAAYYSRSAAYWEEAARREAQRAHAWRGRTGYALGAAMFLLGALGGEDWVLAAGVALVVATVALQGREWS